MFSFLTTNFDICLNESSLLVLGLYSSYDSKSHSSLVLWAAGQKEKASKLPPKFFMGGRDTFYFRPNVDTIAWRV